MCLMHTCISRDQGMLLDDAYMRILPLYLPPRQFFPGGRKRLFYCILDDKICAKVWGVDCIQLCTGCHIFRCTCTLFVLSWHAVLWADVIYVAKVYYEQGWYTTGKLRTGVRAIWIACSVHSVSYLPGPQVSLTVTGCVLRGILAFTDPPPCQPLFASQEMERGIF